jgi:hypothetical protein
MTTLHMGIEAAQAFGYLGQGRNSTPFSPFNVEVSYEFYTFIQVMAREANCESHVHAMKLVQKSM